MLNIYKLSRLKKSSKIFKYIIPLNLSKYLDNITNTKKNLFLVFVLVVSVAVVLVVVIFVKVLFDVVVIIIIITNRITHLSDLVVSGEGRKYHDFKKLKYTLINEKDSFSKGWGCGPTLEIQKIQF